MLAPSILILVAIKMHEIKKLQMSETLAWYDKKGELIFADIMMVISKGFVARKILDSKRSYPG